MVEVDLEGGQTSLCLLWSGALHTHTHKLWLICCFYSTHTNLQLRNTHKHLHTYISLWHLHSACVYEVTTAIAKHRWKYTLKSRHVARYEKLQAGAGCLKKVLDVPPGCQLVPVLHLFSATRQVLGDAHLKVWTYESARLNIMIFKCYGHHP